MPDKKSKNSDNLKDIEQLERDFQFTNYIKTKYDTQKISNLTLKNLFLKKLILEFPKGLKVEPTLFPFQQGKMNEARKNLM